MWQFSKKYVPKATWTRPYLEALKKIKVSYKGSILALLSENKITSQPETEAERAELQAMLHEAQVFYANSPNILNRLNQFYAELMDLGEIFSQFENRISHGNLSPADVARARRMITILKTREFYDGYAEAAQDDELTVLQTALRVHFNQDEEEEEEKKAAVNIHPTVTLRKKQTRSEEGGESGTESDIDDEKVADKEVTDSDDEPLTNYLKRTSSTKKSSAKKPSAKKPSAKKVAAKKVAAKKAAAKKAPTGRVEHVDSNTPMILKGEMERYVRKKLQGSEKLSKDFLDSVNRRLYEWVANVIGFVPMGSNSNRGQCDETLSVDWLKTLITYATNDKFAHRVRRAESRGEPKFTVNHSVLSRIVRFVTKWEDTVSDDVLEYLSYAVILRFKHLVAGSVEIMRVKKRNLLNVCTRKTRAGEIDSNVSAIAATETMDVEDEDDDQLLQEFEDDHLP